ncbi:MAG: hypothetical protein IJ088_09425 [Clostridia bacterium]|nr:hypothetical protein [Clostridia bacterium]
MEPKEVNACLAHYRENVARCAFLKTEIGKLEKIAGEIRSQEIENSVSVTQKWSQVPHGSDPGDPTGQLAQRMADGISPAFLQEIEAEIAGKRAEYGNRSTLVAYVDAWLLVLSERERFVVERECMDGTSWREVAAGFQDRYGELYSVPGLRKNADRAVRKIVEIAR